MHDGILQQHGRICVSRFRVVSEGDHHLLFDLVGLVDCGRRHRSAIKLLTIDQRVMHFGLDFSAEW